MRGQASGLLEVRLCGSGKVLTQTYTLLETLAVDPIAFGAQSLPGLLLDAHAVPPRRIVTPIGRQGTGNHPVALDYTRRPERGVSCDIACCASRSAPSC